MERSTHNGDDNLPSDGPGQSTYERYESEVVDDDRLRVYDVEVADAWLQSDETVELDEMR